MPDRPPRSDENPELEQEGIPDLQGGDPEGGIIPPRDYPQGATEYGTTAEEAHRGEPLAIRLAREEPEISVDDEVGADAQAGRLVDTDLDVGAADDEDELLATDIGADDTAFSAEEAAMHIEGEPG